LQDISSELRLCVWRSSFFDVHKFLHNFKPWLALQQWNKGWSWNKNLKNARIWMSSISESHWWHLFHKEVKSLDSTTWFRIWRSHTPALKLYLQMHLLAELNSLLFGGDNCSFLVEEVKTYLMAPMPSINSSTVVCLHIYSLYLSSPRNFIFLRLVRNGILACSASLTGDPTSENRDVKKHKTTHCKFTRFSVAALVRVRTLGQVDQVSDRDPLPRETHGFNQLSLEVETKRVSTRRGLELLPKDVAQFSMMVQTHLWK
jgi:hypothetical protein